MTTTLLAVDDSKTMRKVLEITFAGEDEYRAVLADSAEDALTKLRASKPRLVLVDAALGGTNGYDLCQKIKAEVPGTSVILLSSKQQPFDRGRGSAVGVDDFIDKPFDTQLLIEKVGAVLSQAAQAAPAAAVQRPAAAPAAVAPTAATPPAAAAAAANRLAQAPASAGSVQEARPRVPTVSYGATAAKPAPAGVNVAPAVRVGATTQTGVGAPPIASTPTATQRQPAPAQPIAAAPPAAAAASAKPAVAPAAAPAAAKPVAAAPVVKPAAAPASTAVPAVTAVAGQTMAAGLEGKLQGLGLTPDQIKGVLALSKEVVEQVVWEVVPVLAETLIREEIERLTRD